MNEGDRRYVIINTTKLPCTTDEWANLWRLVKDSAVREMFWQFLRARDVSSVQPGKAPSNQTKAAAIADQAPDAVQYVKHLCLVAPNDMQPRDTLPLVGSNSSQLPSAVQLHPECFTIKDRPSDLSTNPAFHNLLGDQLDKAMLHYDFVQANRICTNVLEKHMYHCIGRSIQGQRYTTLNEKLFRRDLQSLGLPIGMTTRIAGVQCRGCIVLPSIQGLRYLIKKKGYLTQEEIDQADQPCLE